MEDEVITEERMKKGIEDALKDNAGYVVGVRSDEGDLIKLKFNGRDVQIKIGNRVFTTESIEDIEMIETFLCCVLAKYYS